MRKLTAWKQLPAVVEMAVRGFFKDHSTSMAATLAFYALFSGFPLLLLSVVVSGLFLDPTEAARRVEEVLNEYVPPHTALIEDAVRGAVEAGGAAVAGVSLVALLWSGTRVFAHAVRALNDTWDVPHSYPFITRAVAYPLLVLAMVALLAAGMVYKPVASSLWSRYTGEPESPDWPVLDLIGETVPTFLGFLVVLALYRFLPRKMLSWRDVLPGALVTTLLFQLMQEVFEFYVEGLGARYARIFGGLSSVAVVLLWAYLSAAIFLFGAQFSAAWYQLRTGQPTSERAKTVESISG